LRFAGAGGVKGEQRYETASWSQHQGVWLLDEAAAAFACEVEEIVMCHSHAVVVARVLQIQATEGMTPAPLLYWQGQFGTLQARGA
jgi:flavin reductase (DIM6/NTAB) family NADH-FMN oxidoreductase RutF